jgi:hypothetical protein
LASRIPRVLVVQVEMLILVRLSMRHRHFPTLTLNVMILASGRLDAVTLRVKTTRTSKSACHQGTLSTSPTCIHHITSHHITPLCLDGHLEDVHSNVQSIQSIYLINGEHALGSRRLSLSLVMFHPFHNDREPRNRTGQGLVVVVIGEEVGWW